VAGGGCRAGIVSNSVLKRVKIGQYPEGTGTGSMPAARSVSDSLFEH